MGRMISRIGFAAAVAALCLASVPWAGGAPREAAAPLYKDASAPIPARVEDLLKRMTLQEKVAQMTTIWNNKDQILNPDGTFNADKASASLPNGIGQIARPGDLEG